MKRAVGISTIALNALFSKGLSHKDANAQRVVLWMRKCAIADVQMRLREGFDKLSPDSG
jgi:hypothetical protein